MVIRCKTCRSFRSKNSRIPCSRCNPFEAVARFSKPKKPAKNTKAKVRLVKRISSKKGIFQMGERTETQKKFNGIDHEDTTITISGHHVYVYYGYKPMRTFKEIL